MALVLKDRVKETTTTTGTGTLTLSGAVAGFLPFSEIGNGNTTYYCIEDKANFAWEVGIGTYTLSGTTLARNTVLASSNANALVNFAAGSKEVFCTYPAAEAVDNNGNFATGTWPISITGNAANGITLTSGSPPYYGCRAWVSFNGTDNTNPVTIYGSQNVSSVTYVSAGNYNVNFTTAMPDTAYAAICGTAYSGQGDMPGADTFAVSSLKVRGRIIGGTAVLRNPTCVFVFR